MANAVASNNATLTIGGTTITHIRQVTLEKTVGEDVHASTSTSGWQEVTGGPITARGTIELTYDGTHLALLTAGTTGTLVITWDTGVTETFTVLITSFSRVANPETGAWIRETVQFRVTKAPS